MAWLTVEYAGGLVQHIQTENIVEVSVTSERDADPLTVEVVTNAPDSIYRAGGDYPERAHVEIRPYTINLYGSETESFLKAWEQVVSKGMG